MKTGIVDADLLAAYRGVHACVGCGQWRATAPHHLIRRSELRLDIHDNLLALCFTCHRKAHDNPRFEDEIVFRCKSLPALSRLAEYHRSKRLLRWIDALISRN